MDACGTLAACHVKVYSSAQTRAVLMLHCVTPTLAGAGAGGALAKGFADFAVCVGILNELLVLLYWVLLLFCTSIIHSSALCLCCYAPS
jgi:hypothetical protein